MMFRFISATMLICAFFVSGLNADPIKKPAEKTNAEKLIGKWKLVKNNGTEINDVTVEFKKGGEMILTFGSGDEIAKLTGTYKVTKDGIDYEIDQGAEKKKELLKIKKITDSELVVEDPDNVKEEFEKITEKEKK